MVKTGIKTIGKEHKSKRKYCLTKKEIGIKIVKNVGIISKKST